jgi:hypothetical protein
MATPNTTPVTETSVTTDVTERFGFKYFRARKREKSIGVSELENVQRPTFSAEVPRPTLGAES